MNNDEAKTLPTAHPATARPAAASRITAHPATAHPAAAPRITTRPAAAHPAAAHPASARHLCCESAALWAAAAVSVPPPAAPRCTVTPAAPSYARAATALERAAALVEPHCARAAAAPESAIPSAAPPDIRVYAAPPGTSATARPSYPSAAAASSCAAAPVAAYLSAAAAPSCTTAPAALAPDERIAAILPIYDEHGRGVAVYTAGGGCQIYSLRVRTILARLAERSCRTLPLIRRRMRALLGGRQELPLPISPRLILVPCKVITPRVKGDETIGYFSLDQVVRLIAPPSPHEKPPANRRVKPARGKGRPVPHTAPAAAPRAEVSAMSRAATFVTSRAHAVPRAAAPRTAAAATPTATPRAADTRPAYELTDGRRIPLLITLATARTRLALAAYAKADMFPQTHPLGR